MANCVTELTCIHCGATFPGANLATAEATWMVCPRCGPMDGDSRHRLRPGPRAGGVAEESAGGSAAEPMAIRGAAAAGAGGDPSRLAGRVHADRRCAAAGAAIWACSRLCSRTKAAIRRGRSRTGRARSALTHALQVGAKTIACASTGNAASSLAGHAALAGLPAYIFVPQTAPEPKVAQLQVFGATVFAVKSSYDEAYDLCTKACQEFGWYNRNCAINPVLVEGKKTAGLEIAEQSADFGGVPDWVAVSVGDGCTIAGIWKGLSRCASWASSTGCRGCLAVQADEVNPLEYAMEHDALPKAGDGQNDCRQHRRARAAQLAEGGPRDPRIATACLSPRAMMRFWTRCGSPAGMAFSPSRPRRPRMAGVVAAIDSKTIGPHDRVLVMITGSGLKDTKNAIRAGRPADRIEPDVEQPWRTWHVMHLNEITTHKDTTEGSS